MRHIFVLHKKEGETPLEALEKFRRKHAKYKDVKMTYAGRLDPLVSGLLVVLVGDAVKEKEKYLGLSKEYAFSVLFGFATDTYDILGKVTKIAGEKETISKKELEKKIKENLKHVTGTFMQTYPMYSSKTVAGKPLFSYAREGKPVESPEREVEVKSLKFLGLKNISRESLLKNIERRIAKVHGDFRQKEILKVWWKALKGRKGEFWRIPPAFGVNLPRSKFYLSSFFIADFYIKCGSGTYVRGIADTLGERTGIPALALTIKRTKIGRWKKYSTIIKNELRRL